MPEDVAAWLKPDASIALVRRTEDKSDSDRGGQWWQTRIAVAEEDNGGRRGQQQQKRTMAVEEDNSGGQWRMVVEDGGGGQGQRMRVANVKKAVDKDENGSGG